jgi:hypothetical protein
MIGYIGEAKLIREFHKSVHLGKDIDIGGAPRADHQRYVKTRKIPIIIPMHIMKNEMISTPANVISGGS